MPTYNILKDVLVNGQPVEPVGAGFSELLLTDLLRGTCGFEGVLLSDWAISRGRQSGLPDRRAATEAQRHRHVLGG